MRKILLLVCLMTALTSVSWGQITLSGTSFTESFDNIGNGLPNGFFAKINSTATSIGTDAVFTPAKNAWDFTGSGFKNYASADGLTSASDGTAQGNATDRVIAMRQSGTAGTGGDPGAALAFQIANTTGFQNLVLSFKLQSLDITSPRVTTWVVEYGIGASPTSFTAVPTTPTPLTTGGSTFTNTAVTANFGTALNNISQPIWIRIVTLSATSGAGNRPTTGFDDVMLSYAAAAIDNTAPTVSSLTPANSATNHSISFPLVITFSENIQKGTGNITVTNTTDATSEVISIASAAISVSGREATINASLLANKNYTVTVPSGGFQDFAGNNFAGLAASAWGFRTIGTTLYNFDFNTCTPFSTPASGFTQYSVTGDSVWNCTTFGINGSRAAQMNGFNNPANEDWLISPSLDLTAFNVPVLSFQERTRFAGPDLQVLVSTNYSGTGDPNAATWTPINAVLPAANSDVWTLVDNINLNSYKTANTYIAFKYTSSTAAGAARTTLDDIRIRSVVNGPAAMVNLKPRMLNFDYVPNGTTSNAKSFQFLTMNTTGDIMFTAPASFELSKDNTTFSNTITYTPAQLVGSKTAYVRYTPSAANITSMGDIAITGTGLNMQLKVAGNSYPYTTTLQVVNWNLEWFGSTSNGPTNDAQQQTNAKRVMDSLNADIYALAEIVDTVRLGNLTRSLADGYSYVVSPAASNATTPASFAAAQKLAFVYKTSRFQNVTTRPLLATSTTANANWSTGRLPYLMEADVVAGTNTARYSFIVVHGKANTGTTAEQTESYVRRKAGVKELKDTLDAQFSTKRVIILGDYNDDLDSTIAPGITPAISSYDDLVKDSTDGDSYRAISLALSRAGMRSTVSYPDAVDHISISNEVLPDYIPGSVRFVIEAESYITNYATTTSDHYPLASRYLLPMAQTDFTAPTLTSTNPANNAVAVPVNTTLTMTFSEAVQAGTGNLVVKKLSDNAVATTLAVTAATFNGNQVSWNVSGLQSTTQYYVEVPTTAIRDNAGNAFAGITNTTSWRFSTVDLIAPTLVTFAPPHNQVGVPINPTPLSFTFSEPIAAGTGNLLIKRMIDGSIAATIPATSAILLGGGTVAVFQIPGLANSTQYYVEIQNTAFRDLAGNAYAGFTGSTTFAFFTTALTAVPTVNPAVFEFVIQPNPATTTLKFTFVPKAGKLSYEVIDAKGVVVLKAPVRSVTANKILEPVSIQHLPAGSYLLKVVNNGALTIQQFIKR